MVLPGAYRLIGRPPGAVLFHTVDGPVDTKRFIGQARRLAATLRGAPAVINLCQDRFRFALTLAACVLNHVPCWLVNDRSPASLRALTTQAAMARIVQDADIAPSKRHVVAEDCDNPLIPSDQMVAMVFTSGSTGEPAGHAKSWGALAERSITAGKRFGLTEDNPATLLGTVPPQHMYGFETTVMQPWHAPCASWCGDAFYPADIMAGLAHVNTPRWLITTPLQLRGLVRAEAALPPLQAILSATAPMDPALALAAESRWGAPVLEIFGATECGSIATRRTSEGDVWRLYPGIDMVQDADAVHVRAPHALSCPIADDVAQLAGHRFRLLGRKGDLIKIGGKRASLAGLNHILVGLPQVQDGVFVPPDNASGMTGARMQALVQAPGYSAADILILLRDKIDPVFMPRRVVMVDALPRNDTGKLPRRALDALLARHA